MPSHCHRLVTTGLDPVVHAVATRPERRWERCASVASAWIAGSKSGNDEGKNEKIGSRMPTDAMRILPGLRARPRLSAERRTSIGVPPRFSPQGVFHRKGLSLRPGFLGRGGDTFCASL